MQNTFIRTNNKIIFLQSGVTQGDRLRWHHSLAPLPLGPTLPVVVRPAGLVHIFLVPVVLDILVLALSLRFTHNVTALPFAAAAAAAHSLRLSSCSDDCGIFTERIAFLHISFFL